MCQHHRGCSYSFFRLCHVYFLGTQEYEWMCTIECLVYVRKSIIKIFASYCHKFFVVPFHFVCILSMIYVCLFFKFKKFIYVLILYVICCYQLNFLRAFLCGKCVGIRWFISVAFSREIFSRIFLERVCYGRGCMADDENFLN